MVRFLTHWLLLGLALWVTDWILSGVSFDSIAALAVAALVLGFLNAVVKPILTLLTIPITIVTLGLFYLVVNGFTFWLAAVLVPGFHVSSFGQAILGALVLSLTSWFVGLFLRDERERERGR